MAPKEQRADGLWSDVIDRKVVYKDRVIICELTLPTRSLRLPG